MAWWVNSLFIYLTQDPQALLIMLFFVRKGTLLSKGCLLFLLSGMPLRTIFFRLN